MATQVHRSAGIVWSNLVNGVGPTISGAGNSGVQDALIYERLGLLIAPVGVPTGTTPTITFTITGQDGQGNAVTLLASAAIGTPFAPVLLSVGSGFATTANVSAGVFVPRFIVVSWTVAGTTPVFPNLQATLLGR